MTPGPLTAPLAALFLAAATLLGAQSPPPARPAPPATTASSFADEAVVVAHDTVTYRFHADGTGTRAESATLRIQSASALQAFAVVSLPYASSSQTLEILTLKVHKPDGSVVATPATDAQDQPSPVTQAAPMYSDQRMKQIPVRSLAVGDSLEFETLVTQKTADVPGQFWGAETFGAGLIYLDRRIELHVPRSITVNVYSPGFPPEIADAGDERVYRWKGAQLRRSNDKQPEDTPKSRLPPIAWTTFPDWASVGAWYQSLLAGRDAVNPALQAKADELTASAHTDTERVQALYEYVAQHNHYIAVDFGIGRYQPHPAAEVFANQYGDCKDKHILLAALLRAKGFQPSAVLIGSGIEFNEKVPSPAAFNHLITWLEIDGSPFWLDATTEVAPYRVLLPPLRDKRALLVSGKSTSAAPRLATTPADLPFPALDRYEGHFELAKDGSTTGTASITMRGDGELVMRYASRQVARAQWDQLGQAYVEGAGFNGKASAVTLDAADQLSNPWSMHYTYAQEPWSEWPNFQIGSLLPNLSLPTLDEKKPPTTDIELGTPNTFSATSTIRLPAGYGVDLPKPQHLKTAFATFDQTYRLTEGSLVSDFTLVTLQAKVPAADWKSVKTFADAITTQPWLQLTSTATRAAGEKSPPAPGEHNPAAEQLSSEVRQALEGRNYELATKRLDTLIALNDHYPYVWSQHGVIAWQQNHLEEALGDFEKELRLHPDETSLYAALSQLDHLLGRSAEEHTNLLAFGRTGPKDARTITYLGDTLLARGFPQDAVTTLRAGNAAIPNNPAIQTSLAEALLRTGDKAEAVTLLEAALSRNEDSHQLNTGAYLIAESDLPALLPLAEASASKAASQLEQELAQLPIDSVNNQAFQKTLSLLAIWDTVGWVYFAEGKDQLAEEYLLAAWHNIPSGEVGLHLGQLYEKKQDLKAARRTWEMALATQPSESVAAKLKAHRLTLSKQGVPDQLAHPEQALQDLRTYRVARPADVKGSGTFALLVPPTGHAQVGMLSGDEAVRPLARAIATLDLQLDVPTHSATPLLRSGILFCAALPTCDFVLTPPSSATAQ